MECDQRTQAVRAAAALFTAHGYDEVTLEDVRAAAGPAFDEHFANKDDLFRAAVELLIDEGSRTLTGLHPETPDPAEALREFGRQLAAIVLTPRAVALHRLVVAHAVRVKGLGRSFLDHGPAVGNAALTTYLYGLRKAGVIETADPILAAIQLHQAMVGGLQMRMLMNPSDQPSDAEIDANIGLAVDTFLRGTIPRS